MSYKAIRNIKNKIELDFIKSLTPQQINDFMNKAQSQLKEAKEKHKADLEEVIKVVDFLHNTENNGENLPIAYDAIKAKFLEKLKQLESE